MIIYVVSADNVVMCVLILHKSLMDAKSIIACSEELCRVKFCHLPGTQFEHVWYSPYLFSS